MPKFVSTLGRHLREIHLIETPRLLVRRSNVSACEYLITQTLGKFRNRFTYWLIDVTFTPVPPNWARGSGVSCAVAVDLIRQFSTCIDLMTQWLLRLHWGTWHCHQSRITWDNTLATGRLHWMKQTTLSTSLLVTLRKFCNEVHLNYVKCIIVYTHITLALYRLD